MGREFTGESAFVDAYTNTLTLYTGRHSDTLETIT